MGDVETIGDARASFQNQLIALVDAQAGKLTHGDIIAALWVELHRETRFMFGDGQDD